MPTTPHRAPATSGERYAIAALIVMPQVLLSFVALYWLAFAGMSVAGCEGQCNYAAADATYVGLQIALIVTAVLTYVALVVWQRRGRPRWPIVLGGLVLTILATFVATLIVQWAFTP